jgi:dihydroorotate dehydrogenase (NAD+) catalytic subunit
MRVAIGRLALANPVMVASGTFGWANEYAGLVALERLGAVVTKGLSLEPRSGNPQPRIAETPAGMLNSIGLQNPGLEAFLRDKLPLIQRVPTAVLVNILGERVEDYARLARSLDGLPGVAGLEVNISCPNVSAGGIAFGADPGAAAEVASAVRSATRLPVLVKLSPNVTDLPAIARRVADTGVDGLTLINTLRGMAVDIWSGRPRLGSVIGGLSGPAIRPIAVRAVFEVSRAVGVPVIGCGGIMGWADAAEHIRAGATAVQVGSATFRDPAAAAGVVDGLRDFLIELGLGSCRELVGAIQL